MKGTAEVVAFSISLNLAGLLAERWLARFASTRMAEHETSLQPGDLGGK